MHTVQWSDVSMYPRTYISTFQNDCKYTFRQENEDGQKPACGAPALTLDSTTGLLGQAAQEDPSDNMIEQPTENTLVVKDQRWCDANEFDEPETLPSSLPYGVHVSPEWLQDQIANLEYMLERRPVLGCETLAMAQAALETSLQQAFQVLSRCRHLVPDVPDRTWAFLSIVEEFAKIKCDVRQHAQGFGYLGVQGNCLLTHLKARKEWAMQLKNQLRDIGTRLVKTQTDMIDAESDKEYAAFPVPRGGQEGFRVAAKLHAAVVLHLGRHGQRWRDLLQNGWPFWLLRSSRASTVHVHGQFKFATVGRCRGA